MEDSTGLLGYEDDTDGTVLRGSVNFQDEVIDVKWESLNYQTVENEHFKSQDATTETLHDYKKKLISKSIFFMIIGSCVGAVAACLNYLIDSFAEYKFEFVTELMSIDNVDSQSTAADPELLTLPLLAWVGIACLLSGIAAVITVSISPSAAASGMPQLKSYLNGVYVPRFFGIKTFLVKFSGVLMAVVSGLAVGQEGPMVHIGAIIAGRLPLFRFKPIIDRIGQDPKPWYSFIVVPMRWWDTLTFRFRNDHDIRDFIQGGVAGGIAAAFGTPLSGVLFSLEESASFWNQALTLQMLLTSMMSAFILNGFNNVFHHGGSSLNNPGLFTFGVFDNDTLHVDFLEIVPVAIVGVIGGLLGAIFNALNRRLNRFRYKYIHKKVVQVGEAVVVALVCSLLSFWFLYLVHDCQQVENVKLYTNPEGKSIYGSQLFCEEGQSSTASVLVLQLPEKAIKALFHNSDTISWYSLLIFFCIYFLLTCWCSGIVVPSGLFIPSFLIGACWGRLYAIGLRQLGTVVNLPFDVNVSKYALLGAASSCSGIVRMTISITFMFAEATGNVTFGLPIMMACFIAMYVGNFINHGLYEQQIQLLGIPFLEFEPPPAMSKTPAREVGTQAAAGDTIHSLRINESVERIFNLLSKTSHNAFPVVDEMQLSEITGPNSFGRFRGVILRDQLLFILDERIFDRTLTESDYPEIEVKFRNCYPWHLRIDKMRTSLTDVDKRRYIDLSQFMNPAPYTVNELTSLPKLFTLFRGLGLRHLVVTNYRNQVVGIITRKDIARCKSHRVAGDVQIRKIPLVETYEQCVE